MVKKISVILLCLSVGCATPNHHPDMTASGAVVGSGIGAGAGAIIGNQISHLGEGAAAGAGIGAVSGIMAGISADILESEIADSRQELELLQAQNAANRRMIRELTTSLDNNAFLHHSFGVFQVFFDENVSNMKSGSLAQLDVLSKELRRSQSPLRITVVGHADDSGDTRYNDRLSQSRAQEVVAALIARGISNDQINIVALGSKRPLVSNTTPQGRQLNRRVEVMINQNN